MTALSAIGQALNITKNLRDLERGLDSATYKSQIAELYTTLADVKIALSDTREALHDKDQEIAALKSTIETMKSGNTCPICETGRMKVTASKPHPQFAFAGVQEQTVTCQNSDCKHSEKHLHDPRGVTKR